MTPPEQRVARAVEALRDELVDFAARLIRIPTVNPPGDHYAECARLIGDQLALCGYDVAYHPAEGRPEHTATHPRINVVGVPSAARPGPVLHINGHFDVVPAGDGWTVDPFAGELIQGRLYGRGSADMKAGLAAGIFAGEAIRRAGIRLGGTLEISGTVDEESGGLAGVAWLAEQGLIGRDRTDFVLIPEPLDVERICIGHRGVYWLEVVTRGRPAHGSMPFLGSSAIDHMTAFLEALRVELRPLFVRREGALPVVPEEAARGTLNVNSISGGQAGEATQTPCVADSCRAILDRRFLPEEELEAVKGEIVSVLERVSTGFPEASWEIRDLMVVQPTRTPESAPLVAALRRRIRDVLARDARIVASPGTYDHKHVARIAGVEQCAAYGPGRLEQAHAADEYCDVGDMVAATKVMALSALDLLGEA
jgi:succinyl-diaminopimelate desuccinylase